MSPSSKRGSGDSGNVNGGRPARRSGGDGEPDPDPDLTDPDVDPETSRSTAATTAAAGTAGPYDDDDVPLVSDSRLPRLAAAAGIVYALLGFVGSSLLPFGRVTPTDSAADIAAQITDQRGRVSAGILLTLLSLFFLLVFVAFLYRWLRDAEGPGGWLATLSLLGGVMLAAMLSVVVLLSIGATVLESYGDDVLIARTLLVLQWQSVAIAFVPAAAFVGGTGAVGYLTGVLPRWLSVSGLIIGFGLLVPPLAFLPFLLSSLWIGMLAVYLLQRIRAGL